MNTPSSAISGAAPPKPWETGNKTQSLDQKNDSLNFMGNNYGINNGIGSSINTGMNSTVNTTMGSGIGQSFGFGSSFGGFNNFNSGFGFNNNYGNNIGFMNGQAFEKPAFFVAFDQAMITLRKIMDSFSKFSFMIGASVETINGLINTFFGVIDAISFVKQFSLNDFITSVYNKLLYLVKWILGLPQGQPKLIETAPMKEGESAENWNSEFSNTQLQQTGSRTSRKVRIIIAVLCFLPALLSVFRRFAGMIVPDEQNLFGSPAIM